jgi:arsenate reductase
VSALTIHHNPRCSKSRATLALLSERGVALHIVEYLAQPLSREELVALGRKLGLPPSAWVRRGEAAFADAGLSATSTEDEILDAMVKHPILIERPIVVRGERARIGRPPERVLELLD